MPLTGLAMTFFYCGRSVKEMLGFVKVYSPLSGEPSDSQARSRSDLAGKERIHLKRASTTGFTSFSPPLNEKSRIKRRPILGRLDL